MSDDPHQHEHNESPSEGATQEPFKDGEFAFNSSEQWRLSAGELLKQTLAEKYHTKFNQVLKDVDEEKLSQIKDKIKFIALKDGVLVFQDKDKAALLSCDLRAGLEGARTEIYVHDCDICKRRSRRRRDYEVRFESYADRLRRIRALQNGGDSTEAVEGEEAPLDPKHAEAIERWKKVMERGKGKRENILRTVEQMDSDEYDILATVSKTIRDDDAVSFEKHWRFMDYAGEADELFHEAPKQEAGYGVNPFKEQGWNHEKLRDAMQGGGFWNLNEKLYFREIADEIYGDRLDEFKADLKRRGVKKEILDMMETGNLVDDDEIKDPKDLIKTYKAFKKLSLKNDDEDIRLIVQVLGDYIAYANRLVDLVNRLKYNPGREAAERERTIKEFARAADGSYLNIPENRVKRGLMEVFTKDVENPREYSSELRHLFSFVAGKKREITFQDLNGNTATVESEWFTGYQSPDTAYKLAYEEAVKQKENEDGTFVEEVNEEDAKNHLNDLLQLGIAGYGSMPVEKSIKSIIDELAEAGAKVKFTGDLTVDTRNLFHVLALENLTDLYKKDSKLNKLISNRRIEFARVGSVIYQRDAFSRQTRAKEAREREKLKSAKVKFTEQQANEIIEHLRSTNQFDKEKLAKLKSALIGGAVVVVPSYGGALGIHYEFDNGTMIDITFASPNWNTFAAGGAIGQRFEMGNNVEVTIHAGGGYSFADSDKGGGWSIGGGGGLTKKFESVDMTLSGGGGVLLGPMVPLGFAGIGLNWAKPQEKYEKTLTKKQVETHITEMDALGNTDSVYDRVRGNLSAYPELSKIISVIDNITPPLDENSRRALFASLYKTFKEGIQKQAIEDSEKKWYEQLLPIGAGVGVVTIEDVPVLPYVYLEFNLASRNKIYRLASDVETTKKITEEEATTAILKHYKETRGSDAQKIEKQEISSSRELTVNPQTGELMLKSATEGKFDFKYLDRFGQFRKELSENAKIFVDPVEKGLLLLKPQEAYGNTRVYIDPELKNDVIAVTYGAKLYLSVKRDSEIFIKREDITYPFREGGEIEETTVVITNNPYVDFETVREESAFYLDRTPTTEWVKRPRSGDGTPETEKTQNNFNNTAEYYAWRETEEGKASQRLEFTDTKAMQKSYDNLVSSVTLAQIEEAAEAKIRPEIQKEIDKLAKDKTFIQDFRALTTEKYELKRKRKKLKDTPTDWQENLPELVNKLRKEIDPNLTPDELNMAFLTLTIASFRDIERYEDKNAAYKKFLDDFERPMLTAIFEKYYEGDPEKDKKTKEAVEWTLKNLEEVDVTKEGASVEAGTLFATHVGMGGITGLRRMYNYSETEPKYGVVGEKTLDITTGDISSEVGKMWIELLSQYKTGFNKKEIPERTSSEYSEYQKQMYKILRSPLALKLIPLVSVVLDAHEMDQLAAYYNSSADLAEVNVFNIEPIRHFLELCDRVREAELAGETEIYLDDAKQFKLIIDSQVSMGIYKKCGNITGLLRENFALVHESTKQICYFASMSEGVIDTYRTYSRSDFDTMLVAVIPIPVKKEVGECPPEEKKPHKRPPTKPPGKPTRPPEKPTEPPQPPRPPEEPHRPPPETPPQSPPRIPPKPPIKPIPAPKEPTPPRENPPETPPTTERQQPHPNPETGVGEQAGSEPTEVQSTGEAEAGGVEE